MRLLSLPVTVLALALLVFVPVSSQAAEVEVDVDGNVIRITNLPVTDENTQKTTVYNVEFLFGSANEVYPSGFDFENDETALAARQQVNDILNAEDPIPPGASDAGRQLFYIATQISDLGIVAIGSEYIDGAWAPCETNCAEFAGTGGITIVSSFVELAWAKFNEVIKRCDVDEDCDDGVFCNGQETCGVDFICEGGTAPCGEGQICNEEEDICDQPCACDLNNDGACDGRDWLEFYPDWGRTDCPIQ